MKKNYFYPETETISVESGVLMNGSGNQGGTPPATPPTPGPGSGLAPARKIYM